jgi:phage tail protein X
MVKYQAKEGDVLDWIVWRHSGTIAVPEQVLAANPTLTDEKLPWIRR